MNFPSSGGGSSVDPDVYIQGDQLVPPPTIGGTDINTPVVTDKATPVDALEITCTGGGAPQLRARLWALGDATVVTGRLRWTTVVGGAAGLFLVINESGSGKYVVVGVGASSSNMLAFGFRWSNATTPAAQIGTATSPYGVGNLPVWFKLEIGSTITLSFSHDGSNYEPIGSVALTTAFTTAPDRYGIAVNGEGASASYSVGGIVDSLEAIEAAA